MGTVAIIIIVILSILVLTLGYTTYNLLIKNEKQLDIQAEYLIQLNQIGITIAQSDKMLKALDEKGTFNSDDEVGFFFKGLQDIQEILNLFRIESIEETP